MRIGFDIGGSKIAAAIVDETGRLTAETERPFPKADSENATVSAIVHMTKTLLETAGLTPDDLDGIGIAIPGMLDIKKETVVYAYNLNYENYPLKSRLSTLFPGLPIALENDADAALIAEWKLGALRDCRTGVFLTLGTGVGGGLILDGKPFRGGLGHGTEPGHMALAFGGPACTCGNSGCAEALVAASRLCTDGYETAKAFLEAVKAGDRRAGERFRLYCLQLGAYLVSLANLLDPEKIVLGGGLSQAGPILYEPLRNIVKENSFFKYEYPVLPAAAGNKAGILGAALAL